MKLPYGVPEQKQARIRAFARTMRLLGVLYAGVAAAFWFFPNELIYALNFGPKVFHVTEAIADPNEKLWMVFGGISFVLLCLLSFLAAESPYTRGYALSHLLAKTLSFLGFGFLFLNEQRYFAYLFFCVLDLLIGSLIAWSLIRLGRFPKPQEISTEALSQTQTEPDALTRLAPPEDHL